MAQSPLNGTTQPVDIEEEGLRPTMDREWLNKKRGGALSYINWHQIISEGLW